MEARPVEGDISWVAGADEGGICCDVFWVG